MAKHKKFIPPGTVQVSETFFVDETEISNFSWWEYEFWTETKYGKNSKEHLATLPDTTAWRVKFANEPYLKYYYRHKAYQQYPVVGISYEQAVAFCKWRTERVKEFLYITKKKELNFEYRLPTKTEWELLSCNGRSTLTNNGKDAKGRFTLNCAREDSNFVGIAPVISNNEDVTAPVYSYWKNNFGLFNTFGNVAEMVADKGISKGGSWQHRLEECRAGKDITYSKPEAWLGFRCVCEIKNL